MRLNQNIKLIKTKKHSIDIIVDRIVLSENIKDRLTDSVSTALQLGQGMLYILVDDLQNVGHFDISKNAKITGGVHLSIIHQVKTFQNLKK